jgi:hypothetical protein
LRDCGPARRRFSESTAMPIPEASLERIETFHQLCGFTAEEIALVEQATAAPTAKNASEPVT